MSHSTVEARRNLASLKTIPRMRSGAVRGARYVLAATVKVLVSANY